MNGTGIPVPSAEQLVATRRKVNAIELALQIAQIWRLVNKASDRGKINPRNDAVKRRGKIVSSTSESSVPVPLDAESMTVFLIEQKSCRTR